MSVGVSVRMRMRMRVSVGVNNRVELVSDGRRRAKRCRCRCQYRRRCRFVGVAEDDKTTLVSCECRVCLSTVAAIFSAVRLINSPILLLSCPSSARVTRSSPCAAIIDQCRRQSVASRRRNCEAGRPMLVRGVDCQSLIQGCQKCPADEAD